MKKSWTGALEAFGGELASTTDQREFPQKTTQKSHLRSTRVKALTSSPQMRRPFDSPATAGKLRTILSLRERIATAKARLRD